MCRAGDKPESTQDCNRGFERVDRSDNDRKAADNEQRARTPFGKMRGHWRVPPRTLSATVTESAVRESPTWGEGFPASLSRPAAALLLRRSYLGKDRCERTRCTCSACLS